MNQAIKAFIAIIPLCALMGCANSKRPTDDEAMSKREQRTAGVGRLFGEEALHFGGDSAADKGSGSGGIGVNAYLWRASLDTVSFLPLRFVDPFGGVISTEWYTPPESPNERLKVDVLILDRQLHADGVRVSIFKQHKNNSGSWQDTLVDPKSFHEFEDAILTRARQLKIQDGRANS